MTPTSGRTPQSASHVELGALLKQARINAGVATRALGYSSGHISNVEGGHVTPSQDLVEVYIGLGTARAAAVALLERIHLQSRSARDSSRRSGRAADSITAPTSVDADTSSDDIRRHYTVVRYDVAFQFDHKGAIDHVISTVGIRAVTPGVEFYYTGHSPDARSSKPQGVRITALSGAVLERVNVSPIGASDVYLRLDHRLAPDEETHELSYRVDLSEDQRADPEIIYFTRLGVLAHTLTTQFTPPALPERLWWFGSPDSYSADKPDPDALLSPDTVGRYLYTFDRIIPGWCYGFTWLWPNK